MSGSPGNEWCGGEREAQEAAGVLAYLPAKRLIRYLSTRTAAAVTLPEYPEPGPGAGSR